MEKKRKKLDQTCVCSRIRRAYVVVGRKQGVSTNTYSNN